MQILSLLLAGRNCWFETLFDAGDCCYEIGVVVVVVSVVDARTDNTWRSGSIFDNLNMSCPMLDILLFHHDEGNCHRIA